MESVYRAYKDSCELFVDLAEIIRQEASNLGNRRRDDLRRL